MIRRHKAILLLGIQNQYLGLILASMIMYILADFSLKSGPPIPDIDYTGGWQSWEA